LEVGSAISYLIAFALPCLDAVLPVLPSETVIIAFGVATAGSTTRGSSCWCCARPSARSPGTTCRT
jgi:hypothetical protein